MHLSSLHPASFRDPSGFIFERGGKYYRQVNRIYATHYELLMSSGLYQQLTGAGHLVTHIEADGPFNTSETGYKVLFPQQISFISYASEWCFEQLQDAALLTLQIALISIKKGMILKDATPANVQFINGIPVWIDTLSFELYDAAKPWIAYQQFCSSFLFPLYIAQYTAVSPDKTLQSWPDGIPAHVVWSLLPMRSRFSLDTWMNVYLQKSRAIASQQKTPPFSFRKMERLLVYLLETVNKLRSHSSHGGWQHYYQTSAEENYLSQKAATVESIIAHIAPCLVLDAGANTGEFSVLLSKRGFNVIAIDNDERSIGKLYRRQKNEGLTNLVPLVVDLMRPTPATGFRNLERTAFLQRIRIDMILALALVHHLVFGRNCPLPLLAAYFSDLCRILIIEWIPAEDEKVRQITRGKNGLHEYNQELFESSFERHFNISEKINIEGSLRWIYLMEKR